MEQKPKEITDRQVYETSIGSVCMSKTEYAMYQEEMVKRIGKRAREIISVNSTL